MLLKLLKYDFRAMWKVFSLIWGAALILAFVNRFTMFRDPDNDFQNVSGLLGVTFGAVVMAMFVIAIIFVVQRFSKGLLGDEGYLMHTLPVQPWQLVAAKLICGAVTWIISGVVAFVSPFIMAPMDWSVLMELRFWRDIVRGVLQRPDTLVLILEFCLMLFSAIVLFISVMYMAMSIAHLFSRFRKLAGVAAFIGLYILLVNVYERAFSSKMIGQMLSMTTSDIHGSLLTAAAVMLIPAAVFLAAVCWILQNKLNLE